jgi:hypothetical protein
MVTPGTPDPGTPPSDAELAQKPIETDVPPPPDPGPGPGVTPRLGLLYGSDAGRNSNWDKLDEVIGALQDAVAPQAKTDRPPPAPKMPAD